MSVRLPSLKYNQRRRFCYVQFLTAEEARAATAMHDKALDGQHRLVALISDPDAKKNRSGAVTEGRELYVGNVDRVATESEIREAFEEHGTIENIRMIKNVGGKFTGTAFIVFSKPTEAEAALILNNKPLKSRLLRVSIATDKSSAQKSSAIKVIDQSAKAGSPAADGEGDNARRSSVTSDQGLNEETAKTRRERTVALLGLPETVNDARVQSFFEGHGALRKLTVRRDKAGAIVEFVDLHDAGKVGMGVKCTSLGSDARIGTVDELLGKRTALRPAQASVSRPAQRGGAARRGGLGFKRGGAAGIGSGASAPQGAKSNADFKALFNKSKDESKEKDDEA